MDPKLKVLFSRLANSLHRASLHLEMASKNMKQVVRDFELLARMSDDENGK